MSSTSGSSHRLREFFESDDLEKLRITFRDGDVFRFDSATIVDPSIYQIPDQWNGRVAEHVSGRPPDVRPRFRSGSLIDFVESDIAEIFDENLEQRLYVAERDPG